MTGFPAKVRDLIRERAGDICERCGLRLGKQAHHRRPRGAGGSRRDDTNTASNALWLCSECHIWVESNRTEALLHGFLVLQIASPRKSAVKYRGQYIYLDDLGNLTEVAA